MVFYAVPESLPGVVAGKDLSGRISNLFKYLAEAEQKIQQRV